VGFSVPGLAPVSNEDVPTEVIEPWGYFGSCLRIKPATHATLIFRYTLMKAFMAALIFDVLACASYILIILMSQLQKKEFNFANYLEIPKMISLCISGIIAAHCFKRCIN
jgi:hypothetical protein